jgi:hypothetical protein
MRRTPGNRSVLQFSPPASSSRSSTRSFAASSGSSPRTSSMNGWASSRRIETVRSSQASAELEEERCASRYAIAPHGLSNETGFDPHPFRVAGLSRSTDDVPAG